MALTTTAEYKSYAGISASTWDTQIGLAVGASIGWVERFCSRSADGFESATWTNEAHDGDGGQIIRVRNWPITSVTSVSIRSADGTTTALDSDTYRFGNPDDSGDIMRVPYVEPSRWTRGDRYGLNGFTSHGCGTFPKGHGNILVTYVGGYATVPDDLKTAVWRLVDSWLDDRRRNFRVATAALGAAENTALRPVAEVQAEVAEMLRPWRRGGQP